MSSLIRRSFFKIWFMKAWSYASCINRSIWSVDADGFSQANSKWMNCSRSLVCLPKKTMANFDIQIDVNVNVDANDDRSASNILRTFNLREGGGGHHNEIPPGNHQTTDGGHWYQVPTWWNSLSVSTTKRSEHARNNSSSVYYGQYKRWYVCKKIAEVMR